MNYDMKNKSGNVRQMNKYMLAKTSSMFEYSGLPLSIPSKELEKLLQVKGYAFITEVEGVLYALHGNLGGEQDVYGNPTKIVVANTALNLSKTFDLKEDGILILNDDYYMGLMPLFNKHHTQLAENDINIMLWGYNSRTQKMISAPDDKTKDSADLYIKRIIDGEISLVAENAMFDGVRVQTGSNSAGVTPQQLTELHQYLKATLYNEVGISSNFNMKRERLISSELDQAEDSLFPLVYNMMQNRIDGIKALNLRYDLSVDVDFGSIWHYKNKQLVDGVTNNQEDLPDESRQENGTNQSGDSVISGADSNSNAQETETGQQQQPELNGEELQTPVNVSNDTNGQELDNSEDGNGGEGSGSDSSIASNEVSNENDTENNDDNSNTDNVNADDSATVYSIEELQEIIDSPLSTNEDKQAAQELINELQSNQE